MKKMIVILCVITTLLVITHKLDLVGRLTGVTGSAASATGTTSATSNSTPAPAPVAQEPKVKTITFHILHQLDVSGEHSKKPETR